MIYDYKCIKCEKIFEVVKPVSELNATHSCPECGCPETERQFSSNLHFIGAKVKDAYYNHGLGTVVKSDRQAREIAKQKDLIEAGSESPETLHKESVVKKQEQRDKEWKEL